MKRINILLILSLLGHLWAKGQSPGGVPGCEAWFVTSPCGTDGNGAYRWLDLSGDSVLLKYVGGTLAGSQVSQDRETIQTFNFHPSLRFSPSSGFMDAVLRQAGLAQATIVGVFEPDSLPSADTRLYAVAARDSSAVTKDKVLHSGETAGLDYSPDLLHGQERARALKVVCWERALRPQHSPWGETPGFMPAGATFPWD